MKLKRRFFKKTASAQVEEIADCVQAHNHVPTSNENEISDYRSRFLKDPDVKARTGKLVYVRKEYHERIQRIIQVIGENDGSIYGFVDNVLTEHFERHKDEISELYKESYNHVF